MPVFIFAGMSPFTQEGELPGSRNEFIQWIQDVGDQRGIVREYMKYDNELRTGRNVKQVVYRAMQFAHSDPKGPVYVVGAREVMEEATTRVTLDRAVWSPLAPQPLPADAVAEIVAALAAAHRPLVVTSYVGRKAAAVEELVRFCNRLGVGVLESVPCFANYPHADALYQGNHWNHPFQNRALAEADVVLVIDSDVPWIPTVSRPPDFAAIYHIDIDPLKESMPLWYINARASFRADAATALRQMNAHLDGRSVDREAVAARLQPLSPPPRRARRRAAGARGEPERRHHAGVSRPPPCAGSSGRRDRPQRRHHQLPGDLATTSRRPSPAPSSPAAAARSAGTAAPRSAPSSPRPSGPWPR